MACVYFTMAVLSIPSMVFFYAGNKSTIGNLNELITKVSVGNIGESPEACGEAGFVSGTDRSGQNVLRSSISLQCRYGVMDELAVFGGISSNQFATCQSYYEYTKSSTSRDEPFEWNFFPERCELE